MSFAGSSALVVGANGQDGILVCEKLRKTKKSILRINRDGLWQGLNRISQVQTLEPRSLSRVLAEFKVTEIYFLAAHSRSSQDQLSISTDNEKASHLEVEMLLKLVTEAIALQSNQTNLLFASSMRIYEGYEDATVDESTEPNPSSLYAEHKIRCTEFLQNESKKHENLNTVIAILFNHESVYRKKSFLSSKVIQTALESIHDHSISERIEVLNPDSIRDFGYAPQFTETLIDLVRQKANGTFLICTGKVISVRDFIEFVCEEIGVASSRVFDLSNPSQLTKQTMLIRGDNARVLKRMGYPKDHFLSQRNLVSNLVMDWKRVLNLE